MQELYLCLRDIQWDFQLIGKTRAFDAAGEGRCIFLVCTVRTRRGGGSATTPRCSSKRSSEKNNETFCYVNVVIDDTKGADLVKVIYKVDDWMRKKGRMYL